MANLTREDLILHVVRRVLSLDGKLEDGGQLNDIAKLTGNEFIDLVRRVAKAVDGK